LLGCVEAVISISDATYHLASDKLEQIVKAASDPLLM
jgi:hypothetical protein